MLWKKNHYSKSEKKLRPKLNFAIKENNIFVTDSIAKYYSINLETGEYNWGGAAATSFWINPTENLIVICYTQLFSSPTSYASEFKTTVDQALLVRTGE